MDTHTQSLFPQQLVVLAAILISGLLVFALFLLPGTEAGGQSSVSAQAAALAGPAGDSQGHGKAPAVLGSAHLDLNALTHQNNINETDNARWSLVQGTPAAAKVSENGSSVNWKALRDLSTSGAYHIPAGGSWSFNAAFGNKPGYKNASGVLAGGQCALATVFRGAAIQAGLPNQAKPHKYPIPGFPLDQTVNIWWGRDDLIIKNDTSQDLYLSWDLSPDGVIVSVTSSG